VLKEISIFSSPKLAEIVSFVDSVTVSDEDLPVVYA